MRRRFAAVLGASGLAELQHFFYVRVTHVNSKCNHGKETSTIFKEQGGGEKAAIPTEGAGRSLVPRPVRAIRVTRGGLEPSVLGEFSRQARQVTSHPKSPRTTGNEAVLEVEINESM